MSRNRTKTVLMLAILVMVLVAGGVVGHHFLLSADQVTPATSNAFRLKAIELYNKQHQDYLQVCILLIAALFGVGIVNSGSRLRRDDPHGIVMFVLTAVLLSACALLQTLYNAELQSIYWNLGPGLADCEVVDVFHSPRLRPFRIGTMWTFYLGLLATALTTFHLCLLRKRP
jgi:hypothetical protein